MSSAPIVVATIACPDCGRRQAETMPTDACLVRYDCLGCGRRLQPKPGDCCVFCSWADVPCPPVQASGGAAPEADCRA